jgi:hypothetical protein
MPFQYLEISFEMSVQFSFGSVSLSKKYGLNKSAAEEIDSDDIFLWLMIPIKESMSKNSLAEVFTQKWKT